MASKAALSYCVLGVSLTTAGHGAGGVVVAEVLPQQQRLLILLPGQTVTVIVKVKRLPPGNRGII